MQKPYDEGEEPPQVCFLETSLPAHTSSWKIGELAQHYFTLCFQNVKKHLIDLQKDRSFKTWLTDKNVNRVCSSITSAIRLRHQSGDVDRLRADIKNVSHHVFGDHSSCALDFCQDQDKVPGKNGATSEESWIDRSECVPISYRSTINSAE